MFTNLEMEEKIKQVKEVLEYSQEATECTNVSTLISDWYTAKEKFISLFGGNTIYEVPETITTTLDREEQIKRFEDMVNHIAYLHGQHIEFMSFLNSMYDCFYSNIVPNDMTFGDIKVPKGMKITKAVKLFVKNKDEVDNIQTMLSMVLQANKVTGHLCLSVDPLDYLSSSENTYNWRSCHALDGEYRAGNLSYMLDKSTIVCYLKGDEPAYLPRFPKTFTWNNKKWRMLLFISDDSHSIMAGRQYPFFSRTLLDKVKECLISDIFQTSRVWSDWHDDQITVIGFKDGLADVIELAQPHIALGNEIHPIKELITDYSDLHFNDLLRSSVYKPYYAWEKVRKIIHRKPQHFSIGSNVRCPKCGEYNLYASNSMFCEECDNDGNKVRCADCGMVINEDEQWYTAYGTVICQSCFDSNYGVCANCEEIYRVDDLSYDENRDDYYCSYCLERMRNE